MKSIDDRAAGWFDPQTVPVGDGNKRSNKVDWINPISMSMLQKAVKRNAKTVVMNGIEFGITYGHMIQLIDGPYEMVKLKRTDGLLVPFAYMGIERIRRFEFEADEA